MSFGLNELDLLTEQTTFDVELVEIDLQGLFLGLSEEGGGCAGPRHTAPIVTVS